MLAIIMALYFRPDPLFCISTVFVKFLSQSICLYDHNLVDYTL